MHVNGIGSRVFCFPTPITGKSEYAFEGALFTFKNDQQLSLY